MCRAGRRRQEGVVREIEQGSEEEANCSPRRKARPSCSRNPPHSFGRCPLGGGCQGLHGEFLCRGFASTCRIGGLHAVFREPGQGSLFEDFEQTTEPGQQIDTSLRPGKVHKMSPGPHVAMSLLSSSCSTPSPAVPTNPCPDKPAHKSL